MFEDLLIYFGFILPSNEYLNIKFIVKYSTNAQNAAQFYLKQLKLNTEVVY